MPEQVELWGFGVADRSGKVRWLAHELGLQVVERKVGFGEHHGVAYVALNPVGKIPTARFRGDLMTESTAICHRLAEAFEDPKLWVERGEPLRADYLYWLAAFGESLESRLVESILSRAEILAAGYLELHAPGLRKHLTALAPRLPERNYLCGEQLTVADILAGYSLRLAWQLGLTEDARVREYLGRLRARPAAVAARVFDGLSIEEVPAL